MKAIWRCWPCESEEMYSMLVPTKTGVFLVWYSTRTGDPVEATEIMTCAVCGSWLFESGKEHIGEAK